MHGLHGPSDAILSYLVPRATGTLKSKVYET